MSSIDNKCEFHAASDVRSAVSSATQDGSSTSTVIEPQTYPGGGTSEDPFVVDWDQVDPEDPRQWSNKRRWILTLQLSIATWNVSFASSAYSGGLQYAAIALHTSPTPAVLGISLYVLGFGVGPLIFAPLSEMYGRRVVFLCTTTPYFFLQLGGALATNIETLVVCRFLTGVTGSAPITTTGGQIADLWEPRRRAMATALYSLCTFFGPVSGPIVGGFVSQSFPEGWRIVFWIMFGISGLVVIAAFMNLSETYPPVLLRRRAKWLEAKSEGQIHYVSIHERKTQISKREILLINLQRPFVFLFKELIITCIAIYIGIIFATLYAQFTAYPIVFQQHRNFTPGESGLAFLGIAVGQWIGIASTPIYNRLYWRKGGAPEARLYAAMAGAVVLPIGMFWFAWTTFPSIPAIVSILGSVPFGFAMIAIFTSLNGYIMDTYSLYSASAFAATILLRSIFSAVFPLFSQPMFERLGDQWGCSVFGFLAVACMPIPILFHKYGPWIRSKSKYAIKTIDPIPDKIEFPLAGSALSENEAVKDVEKGRAEEAKGTQV